MLVGIVGRYCCSYCVVRRYVISVCAYLEWLSMIRVLVQSVCSIFVMIIVMIISVVDC